MKNIICIIGLPGSGKTTYAINNYPTFYLFDDMSLNFDSLEEAKNYENIVITDPYMCTVPKEKIIEKINEYFGDSKITFFAFENDIEKVLTRNKTRSRVISDLFISHLSEKYDPNQYENILKIY